MYRRITVHDAWTPYDTYQRTHHQPCTAHLAREPTAVIDHHNAQKVQGSRCWAAQVLGALGRIERAWKDSASSRGRLPAGRTAPPDRQRRGHRRGQ